MNHFYNLLLILGFSGFSSISWANDCFLDAAKAETLVTEDLTCLQQIVAGNTLLSSNVSNMSSALRHLEAQHNDNPDDPEFKTLSQAASKVYYHESHCRIGTSTAIQCNNLRRLALLHDSGGFASNFRCDQLASSHPHCQTYVNLITTWLDGHKTIGGTHCDEGLVSKEFCTTITAAFLTSNDKCNGSATESACETELKTRFEANGEDCMYANFRDSANKGSTPSIGTCAADSDVRQASVDTTEQNSDPEASPSNPTTPSENPAPNEITNEDQEGLEKLTDKVANEVFGGTGGFKGGDFQASSISNQVSVPGVPIDVPSGGDIDAAYADRPGGYNPGGSSALPGIVRTGIPTRGEPGGSPKNGAGGGGGAGGPNGGGAMGGVAGGQAAGANAPGGRSSGRRRGRRASPLSEVAGNMNKGFLSADGGTLPGTGAPTTKESALDKKIKQRLAQNKRQGLGIDKAALQGSLNKHLNGGLDPNLIIESSYFPDHSEIYIWLNQNRQVLDERGQ